MKKKAFVSFGLILIIVLLASAFLVSIGKKLTTKDPQTVLRNSTKRIIKRPKLRDSWYWQLDGSVDMTRAERVYDIDLYDVDAETISELKHNGKYVICYFNAGAYEPYRPDSSRFPSSVIGKVMDGWEDERWLDIASFDKFKEIMRARFELAQKKGCDAVEVDNIDGFENDTGFILSSDDQIRYNKWLADEAHFHSLAIALKNDLSQIALLVSDFDFAINEECFSYDECDALMPFVSAGKPVFGVEYELPKGKFCHRAHELGFSFARAGVNLDGEWDTCIK